MIFQMQIVPHVENLETKKDKAKRVFVTPPLFVIPGIYLLVTGIYLPVTTQTHAPLPKKIMLLKFM